MKLHKNIRSKFYGKKSTTIVLNNLVTSGIHIKELNMSLRRSLLNNIFGVKYES